MHEFFRRCRCYGSETAPRDPLQSRTKMRIFEEEEILISKQFFSRGQEKRVRETILNFLGFFEFSRHFQHLSKLRKLAGKHLRISINKFRVMAGVFGMSKSKSFTKDRKICGKL